MPRPTVAPTARPSSTRASARAGHPVDLVVEWQRRRDGGMENGGRERGRDGWQEEGRGKDQYGSLPGRSVGRSVGRSIVPSSEQRGPGCEAQAPSSGTHTCLALHERRDAIEYTERWPQGFLGDLARCVCCAILYYAFSSSCSVSSNCTPVPVPVPVLAVAIAFVVIAVGMGMGTTVLQGLNG